MRHAWVSVPPVPAPIGFDALVAAPWLPPHGFDAFAGQRPFPAAARDGETKTIFKYIYIHNCVRCANPARANLEAHSWLARGCSWLTRGSLKAHLWLLMAHSWLTHGSLMAHSWLLIWLTRGCSWLARGCSWLTHGSLVPPTSPWHIVSPLATVAASVPPPF